MTFKGAVGDWFCPTVRVCQGCPLSPTLFNIFLEYIMEEVLDSASSMVCIGSRNIQNLRYADDIDIVARSHTKLVKLLQSLDSVSRKFGMEIYAKKMKVMTNSKNIFQNRLTVGGSELEPVIISNILEPFPVKLVQTRESSKNSTSSCSSITPKISMERQKNQYKHKAEVGTNCGKIHFSICLWDMDISSWTPVENPSSWDALVADHTWHVISIPCLQQWDPRMSQERGSLWQSAVNSQDTNWYGIVI